MATSPRPHLDIQVVVHDADVTVAAPELQHLADELRAIAAARLHNDRRVSMGKAAELCGLTVAEFVGKLAELHIPIIQYPIEQLEHDLADGEVVVCDASPRLGLTRGGQREIGFGE